MAGCGVPVIHTIQMKQAEEANVWDGENTAVASHASFDAHSRTLAKEEGFHSDADDSRKPSSKPITILDPGTYTPTSPGVMGGSVSEEALIKVKASDGSILPGLGSSLDEVCRDYSTGCCSRGDCQSNRPPHTQVMAALAAGKTKGGLSQRPMCPPAASTAAQAYQAVQARTAAQESSGLLEDFWEAKLLLLPDHEKFNVDEKKKSQDSSDASDIFWVNTASEMDSTGRTLRCKCKPGSQKVNSACILNEDQNLEDVVSNWQDLPVELLVRILASVDHRTVIVASGVCTGWRDAMRFGILELSFSWCKGNTSKLVQSVAPKFSALQVCNLRNKKLFLNDQAVEALANHCHDLRALDLSNGTLITDASLYALAHGCAMLERLNLSGCSGTSELGIKALADNCSNLMHLNLCGCNNTGSDQALLALARNCIGLQSLNLGWCERVTDLGVIGLASWCSDLRVVDLCGCLLITDQSVIALADKCHHLKILGLYSCLNITDNAMYALANSTKYRIVKHIPKRNRTCHNTECVANSVIRSSTGSCYTSSSSSSSCCSNNDGSTVTSRDYFESLVTEQEEHGLISLNLGMCTYLSPPAVQAVCDAFPGLHTCAEKHSLNISGCLNLISVHCVCVVEAKRFGSHYARS